MEDFLIYLGKVSIAAGAFYLAYLILFQKQKHFGFNRIYLAVSMLLSFLIPLITFTTVKYVELTTSEGAVPTFNIAQSMPVDFVAPAFEFQWYHYLFGLYLLGVSGFFLHLLFGHFKAVHIIYTSKIQQLFNQLINITRKDIHPFSFFNKIVLSEKTLTSPDLEMIVSHEKIHVREKHTFDILFTEILFLFQWFNPFAWLIKGAVRNNLEYKTDDEITKTYDPQRYQLAMVALADKKEVAPFLTALNGSQLKNRIIMMKKKTENKFALVKQLIVLPLLAVLVMGLSTREVKTEYTQSKAKVDVIVDGKVIPTDNQNLSKVDFNKGIDSEEVINALDIKNVIANSLVIDGENQRLYIRTSNYVPGTDLEFEKNTTRNIVLDENKLTEEYFYAIDNKLVEREVFLKQGKIGFDNVVFLTGEDATEKYGEECTIVADATSGVPNFVIQDGNDDWTGENTNLEFYEEKIPDPVMEKFNEHIRLIMKDGIATLDPSRDDFPFTVLNNEKVTHKVVINQADLKYGEVIPPKEAVKEFGEKGENGVLIFSTEAESVEDFRNNYSSKQGQIEADLQYSNSEKYTIAGIEISGSKNFDKSILIKLSGLKIGQEIEMPGNEIKSAISNLWDMGSFSDVKISASNIVDDNIWLDIYLEERQSHPNSNVHQNRIIKGKVTDINGNPLAGATVLVKDKKTGTVTNSEGYYDFGIEEDGSTLSFYMKGFKSKDVNVEGKEEINVELEVDLSKRIGHPNGLPIILVDGVQFTSDKINGFDFATANIEEFGQLINVAPENIESIEVLKDAASIAIYGDKAKNGILIISTKNKPSSKSTSKVLKPGRIASVNIKKMPDFPGGMVALNDWINEEMRYPDSMKEKGITGTVYVTFIVTKKGKIENPQITKGVDPILDKEALRVINSLPKWIPGKEGGKAVDVPLTLPVKFYPQNFANGINIPLGFSPNGDGVHDVFEVRGVEKKYPNFKMRIFNNTGDLLWEYQHNGNTNSAPKWWDGKDSSNRIVRGTYYYEIDYNDGSAKSQSGHFILSK